MIFEVTSSIIGWTGASVGLPAILGAIAPSRLGSFDWLVIAGYGVGMLVVGWYFARRTASTEDYLLGGRTMRPWMVGLSLFATLVSALSYLAYPGEMIKHGPVIFAGFLAYPLVFLVIGWLLIPVIMKTRVTTAYELLESRLGLPARMLGTVIFLMLRLMWMATIVYVTSDLVLTQVLGFDSFYTPWLALALCGITIIYTAMGGLRAVVLTDVIQTFILFGGAIVAVLLITRDLGGVSAWVPDRWPSNWAPLQWGFDTTARVTVANAVLAMLLWYICTNGSDQLAIQRYLATRDVRAARWTLATSLITEVLVTLLLAALGLALLQYFLVHPGLLPEGQAVADEADALFPRFVVTSLPAGLSGLIIAGLLAAAMSSLSSGINSVCSVITVDLVERFRQSRTPDPRRRVRLVRAISVLVGAVVVGMSLFIGSIEGNLFEVVMKFVNLFTAPLFVLFFMALFVPWARTFASIVATLCSVSVAIAIAYFHVLGLQFIWIVPLSLGIGVAVGLLLSFIPAGETVAHRLARYESQALMQTQADSPKGQK